MAADLTTREGEVLETLRRMIDRNGHPPTTRELATELGVAPSMAHKYLSRLRALGRVTWDEGSARTVRVVADGEGATRA